MVMVGEGHGWSKEANNMKFGQAMLDFVDRYIGDQSSIMKGN
jgi:dipeptidyl aminopeptidase/acylaminoacyl peptidase